MSILKQKTLSKPIEFKGVGLHTGKKVKMSAEKKVFSRIHMDTDILQKTGPKLAIFSLYGPIYNLPPPYRGSPPCAIFHNPDDREI